MCRFAPPRSASMMAQRRPVNGLRLLLTTTRPERTARLQLPGHLIVSLHDVLDFDRGMAIHPDVLAVDAVGQRAGEKNDQRGDLFPSDDAANGYVACDVGFHFFPRCAPALAGTRFQVGGSNFRSEDEPGGDQVDPNTAVGHLLRQADGHRGQGSLSGVVMRITGIRPSGAHSAEIDDSRLGIPPGRSVAHCWQKVIDQSSSGEHVDLVGADPVFAVRSGPDSGLSSTVVVDQNIRSRISQ